MDAKEINAQLAEHLMGWQVDRGTRPWTCHDGTGIVATIGEYASYPDFAPATTGDGMLMVIAAMQKRGWSVNLLWLAPDYEAHAVFYRHSRGMDPPIGDDGEFADTAPMAVALAACRALGVEVGE